MVPLEEVNPAGMATIPRTVRARSRTTRERVICAITHDGEGLPAMLIPTTAEVLIGGPEIVARLARATDVPWLVATDDAGTLYETLEQYGPMLEGYRASGSIREARTYLKTGGLSRARTVHAAFTDFRWGKHAAAIVLDPQQFTDTPAAEFLDVPMCERGDVSRLLVRLCLWAGDVTRWCQQAGVDVRPGRGGIAAQFLTDSRWWPDRRRKAPRRLNELARDELPGNHYRLFSEDRHPSAIEFDQKSAHHNVAARVAFTDSDTLHAFGAVGAAAYEAGDRLWISPDDPKWPTVRNWPGLFWARVDVETRASDRRVPLPQLPAAGRHTVPVWSSELEDVIREPGVALVGIVGAVVSRSRGDALNGFAGWALEQLAESAGQAGRLRWLKPLLLAVYGTMAQAARPHVSFTTTATANSEPELVALGTRVVSVHVARSSRAIEPRYVNVVDRGIIESETRIETVRIARALERESDAADALELAELVALYADSVLVAPSGPRAGAAAADGLEHLEWAAALEGRVKRASRGEWRSSPLTDLQMLAVNAYRSDEVTKRPGVARSTRAP
jgi:hypothetical protein